MSEALVARVESPSRVSSRRLMIVLIGAAVFLYWLALYFYVPTLPTYVESKSENLAMVGVVLSMYGLWQALIRFPLGIVADWLGRRKPFLIAGFALAGLGAYLMGVTESVNGLLVGRAITGLAAGTWVPLVVAFSSLFPQEEAVRASSLLTLIGSLGRVLGTAVTGSLNALGGYALAFYLATGAAGLAILVALPYREEVRAPKPFSVRSIGVLAVRRDVLLPALLNLVSQYANWTATFGFVPILAKALGATDVTLSILLSTNVAMLVLGNLVATGISKRLGARRLTYLSFSLLAVGLVGAALSPSLGLLFASQFCVGLSVGIAYPVLMGMSIRHVEDAERNTAMGWHQAVYALGMFSGPAISGVLADAIGIRSMFGVTAFACLAIGILGTQLLARRGRE
ncbi:MAG: MFS transporter [Chloroflexi bacterium]|nr:MFS transporter [Chloroflexota bacterium]